MPDYPLEGTRLATKRETLKEQLSSIRESIARFEKELASGAEKIQKENDRKFELLDQRIGDVANVVKMESERRLTNQQLFEETMEQTMKLVADDVASLFNAHVENMTKPLEDFTRHCEEVGRAVANIEKRRATSEFASEVDKLRDSLGLVRDCLLTAEDDDTEIENEILRKSMRLEELTAQQFECESISFTDLIAEFRRHILSSSRGNPKGWMDAASDQRDHSAICHAVRKGELIDEDLFEEWAISWAEELRHQCDASVEERRKADEDIVMAVQKYTETLQRSLEAADVVKQFAGSLAREV